jgi:hypothetical protein
MSCASDYFEQLANLSNDDILEKISKCQKMIDFIFEHKGHEVMNVVDDLK